MKFPEEVGILILNLVHRDALLLNLVLVEIVEL
jgi:hypothetical protein